MEPQQGLADFDDALRSIVSKMCAGQVGEPVYVGEWTVFTDVQLEATTYFSHNFQRYRYIPFRLAVNHHKCMADIVQCQREGLDEYGHPVGQKGVRGVYHFLDYWLFEALGMVGVKADYAYSVERLHPQELGYDVLLHDEFEWDFYQWYRGERHVLDALIAKEED